MYNPSLSNPSLPPSSEPTLTYPNITNISFTELDVFSALSSLDPAKSMGVDCIGSKLLKHCAPALHIPLHHLFSLNISKHAIPSEWKHHFITPIYKSGKKSLVISKYRPVSPDVMSTWSDFIIVDVVRKEVGTAIIVWTNGQQWAFGLVEEQLPLRTLIGELVEVRL